MRRATAKAAFLLVTVLAVSLQSADAAERCAYDRERMLSLDSKAFDQDLSGGGGGWRAVARTRGCELAAARLIAMYRRRHASSDRMLWWHEGQLRADAGQYRRAIPLLKRARTDPTQDPVGWNHYVDATVAFLQRDRRALAGARERLASTAFAADLGLPTPVDGYMDIPSEGGLPAMRVRWPPNLEVVDGLLACFDKPYAEAYGSLCREPSK